MDELMIPIYVRRIQQGVKILDDVPARIRERVREALEAEQ